MLIKLYLNVDGHFEHLTDETQSFITVYLKTFAEKAIDKFVKGQIEHGGFIADRPMMPELLNEVIDAMWYMAAIKERQNRGEKEL